MWSKEERDLIREQWLRDCFLRYEAFNKSKRFFKSLFHEEEDTEPEERNDVYIYKKLLYPPKSTPPASN